MANKLQIPMTSAKGVLLKTQGKFCGDNIEVTPELEEIHITENGEYTPSKVGYSKVTVDVTSGGGIIDVTELPTENIEQDKIYRIVKDGESTAQLILNAGGGLVGEYMEIMGPMMPFPMSLKYIVVDALPSEADVEYGSADKENQIYRAVFYVIKDTGRMYNAVESDDGTKTIAPVEDGIGIPFKGIINDVSEATEIGCYTILNLGESSTIYGIPDEADNKTVYEHTSATGWAELGVGGGTSSVAEKDVNFYDYDGTLLHAYTVEEAQALTELPPLPTQKGLVCQGWNYDLETIKSHNRALDIGATYITDDGKTRLYIEITQDARTEMRVCVTPSIADGVTIDWGDGSPTEKTTTTSYNEITHTYASVGKYVISFETTDDCTFYFGNKSSSYHIAGSKGGVSYFYASLIQKVELGNNIRLEPYSFNYCGGMKSVTIPEGVQYVNNGAFMNCVELKCVVFPKGLTGAYTESFSGNYSLEMCIPSADFRLFDEKSFYQCYGLAKVIFPDSVTTLETYAFGYCYALNDIFLPQKINKLGSSSLMSCRSMTAITFHKDAPITNIWSNVFAGCSSVAKIVVSKKIGSISSGALQNVNSLKIMDFSQHESVPSLSNTNAFTGIPSDFEIRVPAALYDQWKAATNWSTYASQIVAV